MYTYTHKYQIRKYTNIAVSARKRYVLIVLLSTTPYSAYLHVVLYLVQFTFHSRVREIPTAYTVCEE